jgi:hypothetical protein
MFAGYMLIREDGNGEQLEPVELTQQGFPAQGQEVEWDGHVYRVYRVRHKPDPSALSDDLNHMAAHVWARRVDTQWERRKDGPVAPIMPFLSPTSLADGFVESAILPPVLLSILVLAGYDTLKVQFRNCRRDFAQLVRTHGGTWVMVREAWRLSRLAKRYRNEVASFLIETALAASGAPTTTPARRPPRSSPPSLPSPRRGDPRLRLVPARSDL